MEDAKTTPKSMLTHRKFCMRIPLFIRECAASCRLCTYTSYLKTTGFATLASQFSQQRPITGDLLGQEQATSCTPTTGGGGRASRRIWGKASSPHVMRAASAPLCARTLARRSVTPHGGIQSLPGDASKCAREASSAARCAKPPASSPPWNGFSGPPCSLSRVRGHS